MTQDTPDRNDNPDPRAVRGSWPEVVIRFRWPLVLIAFGLMILGAYWWSLKSARDVVQGISADIGSIAQRFKTGTITTTFRAALPELVSTGSGNLEVATAEVTETFTRSDELRIFWDLISLGQTVTEIRVPVTYRYHVSLQEPWNLEVSGRTCVVNAPAVRPSLPPAIHTDGMEKRVERGWLRFNAAQQMEELEKSITPTLVEYSRDARHLNLARETSRRTVAEFVKGWLLKEDHWRQDRFHAVLVRFSDDDPQSRETNAPTIVID